MKPSLEFRFCCPLCGSSYFGTRAVDGRGLSAPMNNLIGYCKGHALKDRHNYTGCTFQWRRSKDASYFTGAPTKQIYPARRHAM